jgi:HEAT repeats
MRLAVPVKAAFTTATQFASGFNTLSDRYLLVAFVTGSVALVLTALLLLLTVALRVNLKRRERRKLQFTAVWRPVLMNALVDPAACKLPVLQARDWLSFLKLWNYLQESLRGEATDNLNLVARRLHADAQARTLLRQGKRAERLIAILTLGHLRDCESRDDLLASAAGRDTIASLNAARALLQIDPMTGVEQLLPLVLARQDWDVARLAHMLGDARAAFGLLLIRSIVSLKPRQMLRALQLVNALRLQLPVATLHYLLHRQHQPPAVLVAALRIAHGAAVLPTVRAHLAHSNWRVRTQAIHALSRFGEPADVTLLSAGLGDAEWWVRYAAAQALASLPFLGHEGLAQLQSSITDATARQMLAQVAAERGLPSHSN